MPNGKSLALHRALEENKKLKAAISTLHSNTLDWDGEEYIDVRIEDFDALIKLLESKP